MPVQQFADRRGQALVGIVDFSPGALRGFGGLGRRRGADAQRAQFQVEMGEGVLQRRQGLRGFRDQAVALAAGRRSSSSAPASFSISSTCVCRCGRSRRGLAAGISATRSCRRAPQSALTGQIAQAGLRVLQRLAPRSMIACV